MFFEIETKYKPNLCCFYSYQWSNFKKNKKKKRTHKYFIFQFQIIQKYNIFIYIIYINTLTTTTK